MSAEQEIIEAVGAEFHGLSYRERLIVGAVLKHLATPPAEEVREALAAIQAMDHMAVGFVDGTSFAVAGPNAGHWVEGGPTHEPVRPRGTVSDAGVEAALAVLRSERPGRRSQFDVVRAALEAAWEAEHADS